MWRQTFGIPAVLAAALAATGAQAEGPGPDGSAFATAATVAEHDLGGVRGGEGQTVLNNGDLMMTSQALSQTNNSTLNARSIANGDVLIGDGAFERAGMGNYVLNSGSGSNLEAALVVNLIVRE
jgi:hypothetical protein